MSRVVNVRPVVKRWLPDSSSCCCEPWRAIEVDYEIVDTFAMQWGEAMALIREMRATHGHALYRLLRSLPRYGLIRRRLKYGGMRIYIYRGAGSPEDHKRFLKLEREVKRLVKLSTKELESRVRPRPSGLP